MSDEHSHIGKDGMFYSDKYEESEGDRLTVYMSSEAVHVARNGMLHLEYVTMQRTAQLSEPVTLILPPKKPRGPRFEARPLYTGWWELIDTHGLYRARYPTDHPGGPQQAAEAEAARLNELDVRGEL